MISPAVEWWDDTAKVWQTATSVSTTPRYPGLAGVSYETFHFSFAPVTTRAIRLRDAKKPGGARRLTIGELRLIAMPTPPPTGPFGHTATLTVTDPFGAAASADVLVSINNTPPTVDMLSPLETQPNLNPILPETLRPRLEK